MLKILQLNYYFVLFETPHGIAVALAQIKLIQLLTNCLFGETGTQILLLATAKARFARLDLPNSYDVYDDHLFCGEQGWRSSESARLPPVYPGFDSRTRRHLWAEFVGSLICSERFSSGNSGFSLSSKTNI